MFLLYIIRYSFFIHSLYKLNINENDKTIKYVNDCVISCGSLAIKLLQLVLSSKKFKLKSNKLDFVLEDCVIHPFEETQKLYFKEKGHSIFDDYNFDLIDGDVIGSGSIGQVHRAYCKKRKEYIAIKIKHPNIDKEVSKSVSVLKFICYFFKSINKLHDIIIEFIDNIHLQIDYVQEAKNTIQLKKNFCNENFIIIPEIFEYNNNFIIMSYHHGEPYESVPDQTKIIASLYMNFFYLSCIVNYDFMHLDLHYGNWKIICDNGDDGNLKLLIYDCGIMFSTGDIDFNRKVIDCMCNRRTFIQLLDIMKEKEPDNLLIDKHRHELEDLIKYNISGSECITKFLSKLIELKLFKDKNLINILSCMVMLGESGKKGPDMITKYIYSEYDTISILYYIYSGILVKMNKFNELNNFFISELEKSDIHKKIYTDWLFNEFGHKNGNILTDIIYNKVFLLN